MSTQQNENELIETYGFISCKFLSLLKKKEEKSGAKVTTKIIMLSNTYLSVS